MNYYFLNLHSFFKKQYTSMHKANFGEDYFFGSFCSIHTKQVKFKWQLSVSSCHILLFINYTTLNQIMKCYPQLLSCSQVRPVFARWYYTSRYKGLCTTYAHTPFQFDFDQFSSQSWQYREKSIKTINASTALINKTQVPCRV